MRPVCRVLIYHAGVRGNGECKRRVMGSWRDFRKRGVSKAKTKHKVQESYIQKSVCKL